MRLDDPSLFKFWNYNGGELGCRFLVDALTPNKYPKVLSARLNTPCSIMRLALAVDAINRAVFTFPQSLEIGYMPYARQDKIHAEGDPLAVKIAASMLDNLGFSEIHILDPHSDVTQACFSKTNLVIDNGSTYASMFMKNKIKDPNNSAIIIPDIGASKRSILWGNNVGITKYVQVHKQRDPITGNILGFKILDENPPEWWDNLTSVFLLDDICDKGGTFIGIMEHLLNQGINIKNKTHLYVSHGIFPENAIDSLLNWFTSIGSTNTWKEFDVQTQEKKNLFVQRWFD